MDQENTTPEGLSRRDLLRRGAALGGALAWATPVVQVIGMSPALATGTSPIDEPDCVNFETFRAKYEWNGSAWVVEPDAGVGANDCPTACDGANGVDGTAYLNVTGTATSATICPKPDVEIIDVQSRGGPPSGPCRSGSPSSGGCWTVSGDDPELSNITICFRVCVD